MRTVDKKNIIRYAGYNYNQYKSVIGESFSQAGLRNPLDPWSRAPRKWRENEEMKRKWRENEEMERKWRENEEMDRE